ncbi:MAG: enoyl-CoA hydratase-related protein [Acidimicrobiales bacterium]
MPTSDSAANPEDDLLVQDDGPVRRITFNQPRIHNAQSPAMLEKLVRVLDQTKAETDIRVLVLAGAGRSFSSGHDLKAISTDAVYAANTKTAEDRYWQELRLFVEPVRRFRELPIPTICRVQGYCLAAGLMFACSSDFVVASEDAVFGSPVLITQAVNDAEVPAFAWRLGERRAKQAIWLNEQLNAAEALQAGLVNWVVPIEELDGRVNEVATKLLAVPRQALALSKATFQFMSDRMGRLDVDNFHYVMHQFTHQTAEARALLEERIGTNTSAQNRKPEPE